MIYDIIQAYSIEKILTEIHDLNKKGWEVYGPVNVHYNPDNPEHEREVYTQCLVKEGGKSRWNLI